jgi:hypothetical protein
MPLQSSGSITFANIQTEFGGTNPIGINEYYLNGTSGYVAGSGAVGIPTSGQISINQFYGKSKVVADTVPTPVTTNLSYGWIYFDPYIYLGNVIDVITGTSVTNLSRSNVSTFNLVGLFNLSSPPGNRMYFSSYVLQARAGDSIQINVGWERRPYQFESASIYVTFNFGDGYRYLAYNPYFGNYYYGLPANFSFYPSGGTATFNFSIPSFVTPGNYAIRSSLSGSNPNAYYYSLHIY